MKLLNKHNKINNTKLEDKGRKMYFFTSDIHFCSENNLKTNQRPFKNSKDFDDKIIKIWNKQVKKEDTIFVIGDFVDCNDAQNETWKKSILYVKKIKAKVVLILGNNEQRVIRFFFDNDFQKFREYCIKCGFCEVYENLMLNFCDIDFYLVHKPKEYKKGMLNLFGHMHRTGGIYKPFGFNVGCDLSHFKLLDENDIMFYIEMKETYWDKDEHINMKINEN